MARHATKPSLRRRLFVALIASRALAAERLLAPQVTLRSVTVRPRNLSLNMLSSLTQRNEWKLATVLPRANAPLAAVWWLVLLLRGVLPAMFAVAMGVLVGAIQRGEPLTGPLSLVGVTFVLLQVLNPIHTAVSANLG